MTGHGGGLIGPNRLTGLSRPNGSNRLIGLDSALRNLRTRPWSGARAAARQERLLLTLEAVIGALRSGTPAAVALSRALDHAATGPGAPSAAGVPTGDAPRTRAALRMGGDVVEALRIDARTRGAEVLGQVAVCWQVSYDSGAGLAAGLAQVVDAEQAARAVRDELAAAVASAQASATVLALLPFIGLALGTALGADPLGWLLGTPLGWIVLAVGLSAEALGLLWSRRIVARVERMALW